MGRGQKVRSVVRSQKMPLTHESRTLDPLPLDPWTNAMKCGDFQRAWEVCDAVLQARRACGESCWHLPRHQQFIWNGESLADKRVLIRCYHGLGDTIQCIRFAEPLRR